MAYMIFFSPVFFQFRKMRGSSKVVSDFERLRRFGTVGIALEVLNKFRNERLDGLWAAIVRTNDELEKRREKRGHDIVELDRREIEGPLEDIEKQLLGLNSDEELPDGLHKKLLCVLENVYFTRLDDRLTAEHELRSDKPPSSIDEFRALLNRLHSTFTSMFNEGVKTKSGGFLVKDNVFRQMKRDHKELLKRLEKHDGASFAKEGMSFRAEFVTFCIVYG